MNKETRIIDPESGDHIQDILDNNPTLYYDESVFREVCKDLGQETETEFWSKTLSSRSSMEEVVNAMPSGVRLHGLKLYAACFHRTLHV